MNDPWPEVISAIVAAAITVLWRLIDRYLPDHTGEHPLPERPKQATPPSDHQAADDGGEVEP